MKLFPILTGILKSGFFDSQRVLNDWVEKLNNALKNGYDGLRLSGNTFWLEKEDWNNFVEYEEQIDSIIGNYQMMALCTYYLDRCNATEIIDVVINHQFALIKKEGKWEQIESSQRKRAKQALRESEKRYRMLFDHSVDAIVLSDPRHGGKILSANPAACRMLGWAEEELIGKRCSVIFDLEDPALSTLLDERTNSGSAKAQLTYRRKDGTTFPGEVSTALFTDSNGESQTVAIIRDITERKQLEEEIRRRAEEVTKVMEIAPAAIFIGHDPQNHSITGNRMANEFYEAEVGENVSANVTPVRRFFYKGRELTANELPMQEAALKNIYVRNAEIDVLLPSGKWRGLLGSASPMHDANGRVRGSIGAFLDITERKQTEKALQESEQRLQAIIDGSSNIVYVKDVEGSFILVNKRLEELLGITRDEIRGKTDCDLFPT